MHEKFRACSQRDVVINMSGANRDTPSRSLVKEWCVFLGFVLLTLVLLSPATWSPMSEIIGDYSGDSGEQFWNFWWMREALLERHIDPFFTDRMFAPSGTTLLLHTFVPLCALLSIPIQFISNITFAYNLCVVGSLALSGFTMYKLVRYLTGHETAGVLAGITFAFSSFQFAHALGHLSEIVTGFLPLFVLCVIKFLRDGRRHHAIGAGVWLSAIVWCTSWYQLLQALMLGVFMLVGAKQIASASGTLRRVGWLIVMAGVTFLCLGGPLIFRILAQLSSYSYYGNDPVAMSADLLSFFVPTSLSTYGSLFMPVWETFSTAGAEGSTFIGYTVLIMSAVALKRQRAARFWGVMALVFFILSLGPVLQILGHNTGLPLPYRWLDQFIPIFQFMGVPSRFDLLVTFATAILVGYGSSWWLTRLRARRSRWLFVLICGFLLIAERSVWPYEHWRVPPTSPFYEQLANEPGDFTILDIGRWPQEPMYFQPVHGKRMINGAVSRITDEQEEFFEQRRFLGELLDWWDGEDPNKGLDDVEQFPHEIFTRYDIRYVIVHQNPAPIFHGKTMRIVEKKKRYLQQDLHLSLVYEDLEIAVYATQPDVEREE